MIQGGIEMNEVLKTIKNRRSVRQYQAEQIKDVELTTILEAASYAPSGHNCQPWHFTVIQNKDLLNLMNEKIKEQMRLPQHEWANKMGESSRFNVFYEAPTVIIVSGDETASSPLPLAGTNFHYTPLVDCAGAIENMMLAAESIGIGSCWLGLVNFFFALPETEKLQIPLKYKPFFAVTLGYKGEKVIGQLAPKRKTDIISYIR